VNDLYECGMTRRDDLGRWVKLKNIRGLAQCIELPEKFTRILAMSK